MLYTALLDSVASEHAARMVAMQTATDNADELLRVLNLQYNKSRQQAIISCSHYRPRCRAVHW